MFRHVFGFVRDRRSTREYSFRLQLECLEARTMLDASPIPTFAALPAGPLTGQQVVAMQIGFNSSASNSYLSSMQQVAQQSVAVLTSQDTTEAASLIAHSVKLAGVIAEGTAIVGETVAEAAVRAAPLAENPPAFVAGTAGWFVQLIQPKVPELTKLTNEAIEEGNEIGDNPLFKEAWGKIVELWSGAEANKQFQSQSQLLAPPLPCQPLPQFREDRNPLPMTKMRRVSHDNAGVEREDGPVVRRGKSNCSSWEAVSLPASSEGGAKVPGTDSLPVESPTKSARRREAASGQLLNF